MHKTTKFLFIISTFTLFNTTYCKTKNEKLNSEQKKKIVKQKLYECMKNPGNDKNCQILRKDIVEKQQKTKRSLLALHDKFVDWGFIEDQGKRVKDKRLVGLLILENWPKLFPHPTFFDMIGEQIREEKK